MRAQALTFVVVALALAAPARAQDDPGVRAVAAVAPAVAALEARGEERRLGSAVVVHRDGYLVTNAHVVAGAATILVALPGRAALEARLLATAPDDDLALLQVDATGLPAVTLALGGPALGQACLAIGNPLGLEGTVTRGVISSLSRRIVHEGRTLGGTFLQTDAAIHPGSSGGALVDLTGQVIGITTAVEAGGQGIGFAIPADRVRRALAALSDPLLLRERFLGVTAEDAPGGARVVAVEAGGPGAAAGLRPGDLITAVGADAVRGALDLHVPFLGPGEDALRLAVTGQDGRARAARLAPGPPPWITGLRVRLGALVRRADGGALVDAVDEGGPAQEIGLRRGDVILRAGSGAPLDDARALWTLVEPLPGGAPVAVTVRRDGREYRGELRIR